MNTQEENADEIVSFREHANTPRTQAAEVSAGARERVKRVIMG